MRVRLLWPSQVLWAAISMPLFGLTVLTGTFGNEQRLTCAPGSSCNQRASMNNGSWNGLTVAPL